MFVGTSRDVRDLIVESKSASPPPRSSALAGADLAATPFAQRPQCRSAPLWERTWPRRPSPNDLSAGARPCRSGPGRDALRPTTSRPERPSRSGPGRDALRPTTPRPERALVGADLAATPFAQRPLGRSAPLWERTWPRRPSPGSPSCQIYLTVDANLLSLSGMTTLHELGSAVHARRSRMALRGNRSGNTSVNWPAPDQQKRALGWVNPRLSEVAERVRRGIAATSPRPAICMICARSHRRSPLH